MSALSSAQIKQLIDRASATLATNDLGDRTRPTPGLYPHQWLWDSCFIAIGLANLNVARAQQEIRSLLTGQWQNGMLPHIIFADKQEYYAGTEVWQSQRHPAAPEHVHTTAMTQPPMVAEAAMRIAEQLDKTKRREWLQEVFEPLVRHHSWLYTERDPNHEGLVFLIHPWESGLDNSPPWMQATEPAAPLRIKIADTLHLESWFDKRRKDAQYAKRGERLSTKELYTLYRLLRRLRHRRYDISQILDSDIPLVIDLAFNAILIRANTLLKSMADELDRELPPALLSSMNKAEAALQTLSWEGHFYNRNFRSRKLLPELTIADFLPLYSGAISPMQAESLVGDMTDTATFGLPWPLPSVPKNSRYFKPRCYWQGPTWINMNWLIIDGLKRNGFHEASENLRHKTLQLVAQGGMYEYFSPLDGAGAGAQPFSWTAALAIDLAKSH